MSWDSHSPSVTQSGSGTTQSPFTDVPEQADVVVKPETQWVFREVVYEEKYIKMEFCNGVSRVISTDPSDPTPEWRFDTAAVVLHVDGPDKRMKDYTRVTFQRWEMVLKATCGDKTEREAGLWRFLFPKQEAVRLTVVAMATGIVQIAFNEVWRITKFLGSGGFADVYAANGSHGVTGAVKISRRKFSNEDYAQADKAWKKLQQEVEVMREMQGCEYVPQLYGAYMLRAREGNKLATTLCCVMQLLPISLSTMRKTRSLAEIEVKPILHDVLSALQYFHMRGVVHRDVKISNVMLQSESGPAHLVDFGFACNTETLRSRQGYIAGTAGYLAPELFENKAGRRADIYACGILFFNLVSAKPAFSGESVEQVLEANKAGIIDYTHVESMFSNAGLQMVKHMTIANISQRPTASSCLSNPWFRAAGCTLCGYPPNDQSSRYPLQLRGAQVMLPPNHNQSKRCSSSYDTIHGDFGSSTPNESRGAVDLIQQFVTAHNQAAGGSPGPKQSKSNSAGASPLFSVGAHSDGLVIEGGDLEFSSEGSSAGTNRSEAFAGAWGAASRHGRSRSKQDRERGSRHGRWVPDLIQGGILESLRHAAGVTRASVSSISKGFELSLRTLADEGKSPRSGSAADMTLHSHVRPPPRQEESSANAVSAGPARSPASWDGGLLSRSAEVRPMSVSKDDPGRWDTPDPDILNCLDDMLAAEDGRVILAVADTPATFLQRAVQRHQHTAKDIQGEVDEDDQLQSTMSPTAPSSGPLSPSKDAPSPQPGVRSASAELQRTSRESNSGPTKRPYKPAAQVESAPTALVPRPPAEPRRAGSSRGHRGSAGEPDSV